MSKNANHEGILSSWAAEAAAQERMANALSQNALLVGSTDAEAIFDTLGHLPYPREVSLEDRTLSLLPSKTPSRTSKKQEGRVGTMNHSSESRRDLVDALLSLFEVEVGASVLLATDEIRVLENYLVPLVRSGDSFPWGACTRLRKNLTDRLEACEVRAFKTALPWRAYFSVLGAIAKHVPIPETAAREYRVWRRWENVVDESHDASRRYLDLYRHSHE